MSYEGWIVVCVLGILLCGVVVAYKKQTEAVARLKSKASASDTSGS